MKNFFNILIFCNYFSLILLQAAEYNPRLLESFRRPVGAGAQSNVSAEDGLQRQLSFSFLNTLLSPEFPANPHGASNFSRAPLQQHISQTDLLLQALLQENSDASLLQAQPSLQRAQQAEEPLGSYVGQSSIDLMQQQMRKMQEQLRVIGESMRKEPESIPVKKEVVASPERMKSPVVKKPTKRKSYDKRDKESLSKESGEKSYQEDDYKEDDSSFVSESKRSSSTVGSRGTVKRRLLSTYVSKNGSCLEFPDKVFEIPNVEYRKRLSFFLKYLIGLGIIKEEEQEPFLIYRRRLSLRVSSRKGRDVKRQKKEGLGKEFTKQAKIIAALKIRLLKAEMDASTPIVSDEESL